MVITVAPARVQPCRGVFMNKDGTKYPWGGALWENQVKYEKWFRDHGLYKQYQEKVKKHRVTIQKGMVESGTLTKDGARSLSLKKAKNQAAVETLEELGWEPFAQLAIRRVAGYQDVDEETGDVRKRPTHHESKRDKFTKKALEVDEPRKEDWFWALRNLDMKDVRKADAPSTFAWNLKALAELSERGRLDLVARCSKEAFDESESVVHGDDLRAIDTARLSKAIRDGFRELLGEDAGALKRRLPVVLGRAV